MGGGSTTDPMSLRRREERTEKSDQRPKDSFIFRDLIEGWTAPFKGEVRRVHTEETRTRLILKLQSTAMG